MHENTNNTRHFNVTCNFSLVKLFSIHAQGNLKFYKYGLLFFIYIIADANTL
jgi:hypothetical protein